MPEIAFAALEPRLQKPVESARAAQLKLTAEKSGFGRFMANVSNAPFVLGGSLQLKDQPLAAVASATTAVARRQQRPGP